MPYSFMNDYSEGAHEKILEALVKTNREQLAPYGTDLYSDRARASIKEKIGLEDCEIHFLTGGTQTNLITITAALKPFQGVLAAESGHIHVHEAGSIEAAGHKIMALPAPEGKITAEQVEEACRLHYADGSIEHLCQPGLVYISHPTEYGTLYTKSELTALRKVCDQYGLILYCDGARLGSAIMAEGTDVSLKTMGELMDAFYIGGTKMGALSGEALVLKHPRLREGFRYMMVQRGGMPAKGRLNGIQFDVLFTDGLYEELGAYANRLAKKLREGIAALGYAFYMETVTNQIFPLLPKRVVEALSDRFTLIYWGPYDEERDIMRMCTCWATEEKMVDAFLEALKAETK